jgi:hypothetical protein
MTWPVIQRVCCESAIRELRKAIFVITLSREDPAGGQPPVATALCCGAGNHLEMCRAMREFLRA